MARKLPVIPWKIHPSGPDEDPIDHGTQGNDEQGLSAADTSRFSGSASLATSGGGAADKLNHFVILLRPSSRPATVIVIPPSSPTVLAQRSWRSPCPNPRRLPPRFVASSAFLSLFAHFEKYRRVLAQAQPIEDRRTPVICRGRPSGMGRIAAPDLDTPHPGARCGSSTKPRMAVFGRRSRTARDADRAGR